MDSVSAAVRSSTMRARSGKSLAARQFSLDSPVTAQHTCMEKRMQPQL